MTTHDTTPGVPGIREVAGFEVYRYDSATVTRNDGSEYKTLLRTYRIAAELFKGPESEAAELSISDADRRLDGIKRLAKVVIHDYGYSHFYFMRLRENRIGADASVSSMSEHLITSAHSSKQGERSAVFADMTVPLDASGELKSVAIDVAEKIGSLASRKLRVGLILSNRPHPLEAPPNRDFSLNYQELPEAV